MISIVNLFLTGLVVVDGWGELGTSMVQFNLNFTIVTITSFLYI